MSKVFVPSLRFKNVDGQFVPAADISPAEQFGELVYLTTPGNNPVNDMSIGQVIDGMTNVTEDDFILLTGDTVLTSIAIGEMAGRLGQIRVLRWNGRDSNYAIEEWEYEPFVADLDEVDLSPEADEFAAEPDEYAEGDNNNHAGGFVNDDVPAFLKG